ITGDDIGPSDAANAAISDTLPPGLTFVSLTQTSGPAFSCTTPAVGSGGTVNCTIADLPVDSTPAFTLVAHNTNSAGSTVSNTATITSTTTDLNPDDNAATANSTVSNPADLSATASGPGSVASGADA